MTAKAIWLARSKIRHLIISDFAQLNSREICQAVKNPAVPDIRFVDLIPYCERAEVDPQLLPDIFASYEVSTDRIPLAKFIQFVEDEVTCKSLDLGIPKDLTFENRTILSKFCRAIRSRRTTGSPMPNEIISERASVGNIWAHLTRLSPSQMKVSVIRVAGLCHLAQDMRMTFSAESLIDALFQFLQQKVEFITFQQFTLLMDAF
jgi:hypothetical protein